MTRKLSDALKAASARPYSVVKERRGLWNIKASDGFIVALESDVDDARLLAHAANQIEGLVAAAQAVVYGYVKSKAVGPDDAQIEGRIENLRSALAKATTVDL